MEATNTKNSPCYIMCSAMIFLYHCPHQVVVNAIVMWLLVFHICRNVFSVYMLNLAGTNFLFLCSLIVFYLHKIINLFHSIYILIPCFSFFPHCVHPCLPWRYKHDHSHQCCALVVCHLSGLVFFRANTQNTYQFSFLLCSRFLSLLLSILEGQSCSLCLIILTMIYVRYLLFYCCLVNCFICSSFLVQSDPANQDLLWFTEDSCDQAICEHCVHSASLPDLWPSLCDQHLPLMQDYIYLIYYVL